MATEPAQTRKGWLHPKGMPLLAAQFLVLLAVLLIGERFLTRDALRGPAPELNWSLVDGSPMTLGQLHGQSLLVYFWATWCPVCKLEQHAIDSLAREGRFVSVAMQSGTEAEVRAWLGQHKLDWPLVADADGSIAKAWGVSGVPTFFILNPRGEIVFVSRGLTSPWGLQIRLWLAAL